ncbi:MAG: hypothetical protein IPK85_24210 [Gemmatimonadetes bacterium]|nr:hypothetical protein [Gemmatimonadota bacterium]
MSEERATYYRGDDRVAAVDRRLGPAHVGGVPLRPAGAGASGEHEHDLRADDGRGVCDEWGCGARSGTGDQELAEIRAPIDGASSEELDSGFPTYQAPSSTLTRNPSSGGSYGPGLG